MTDGGDESDIATSGENTSGRKESPHRGDGREEGATPGQPSEAGESDSTEREESPQGVPGINPGDSQAGRLTQEENLQADEDVGGESETVPAPQDIEAEEEQPTIDIGTAELTPAEIEAYTTDRRSLASKVQLQWGIRTTIGTFILGFILSFALTNFGVNPVFAPVVIGAIVSSGLMWVILRYRVWVYQIRADAIYLERGVVTHVRTLVPYVRIQHVDTSRGPLERALGLSTLVVYTAGSRGADVSIPGLHPEQARDLQQRVKELAIEADGGDAL